MSATKFMTFPNAKDDISTDFKVEILGFDDFPDNATIVAAVGKARIGKSTFLNSTLFELGIAEAGKLQFREKDPEKRGGIFKTGSTGTQVTRGIDCFLVKTPNKNYLFMDVQGIMEGNAGFDHGLLMAAYSICDVFIYNQPNTVTHDLFDALIPMASFLPCVSTDRKPVMILRLFDRSLDSAKADLDQCMESLIDPNINDTYKTIRRAINQLFSSHHIVYSCPINLGSNSKISNIKDLLHKDDEYRIMIENTIKIIQTARTHSHSDFTQRCETLADEINGCDYKPEENDALLNKNKLDLIRFLTKITGKNNIDITTEDSKVSSSGSRCDGLNIAEIIKRRTQQYEDYVKKFDTVAESVRTPYFEELHAVLFDKINELANINRSNAWKSVNLSACIQGKFGLCPNNIYNAPDFNIDAHLAEADKYDICVRDTLVMVRKYQLKVYQSLIEEHTERMTKINKKITELHDVANKKASQEALSKRSPFSQLFSFVRNLFTDRQRDLLAQINALGPYRCDIKIYWNNATYVCESTYVCEFTEVKIAYDASHFKLTENIEAVQKARYNDIKNNYYKSIPGKLHEYLGEQTPTYIVHHLEGLTEMYNLARTYYANQGISMEPPQQYEAHGRQYYSKIKFTGKHSGFEAIYENDFIKYLMKSPLVYSEL